VQRLIAIIPVVVALALSGSGANAAPVFEFAGHGWGHAVGMTQYGAWGFAQNGWSYDRILAHYYPGTELTSAPASKVRVLLAQGRSSLEISSEAPFTITDADGTVVQLPAGAVRLSPGLAVTVDGQVTTLAGPLRFKSGGKALALDRRYRGQLVVYVEKGALSVVNVVGLERYLQGVVAGEMPASWDAEALKAQAVASRSYALVSKRASGAFDLYADTRSQVYGGIGAEHPRTNAAIAATARKILTWEGEVAWTFFSASSGGRTAAVEDVWAGAEPVPYLVSVDDPYDTLSPYHSWGPVTFTEQQLRARLGSRLPQPLVGVKVKVNKSGRVATVIAVGDHAQAEFSGSTMRSLLGLRSTWFTIDVRSASK
jgi:stage II sporulation protein D